MSESARRWLHPYLGIAALIVVYLGLAFAYGRATPDFEGPDSGAHLRYAAWLDEAPRLPVYDMATAKISHEIVQQPPLYYAMLAALTPGDALQAAATYEATTRSPYYGKGLSNRVSITPPAVAPAAQWVTWLARGLTLAGGALTVLLTWALAQTLLSGRRWLPLAVASVVALNPQYLFSSTTITNDIWAGAFAVLAVWLAGRATRGRTWLAVGVAIGLATLTKYSGVLTLIPAGVLLLWALPARRWRRTVVDGLLLLAGFVLVTGWLGWHNWQATGALIPTGLMPTLLPGLARPEPLPWEQVWARVGFLRRSYTGIFGYGVRAAPPFFEVVDLLLWLAAAGLVIMALRWWRRPDRDEMRAALVAVAWAGGTIVALAQWIRVMGASEQGRLLFPAAPAIALLLVLGWQGWLPRRWQPGLALAIPAAMLLLGLSQLGTVRAAYQLPAPLAAPPRPERPLQARFANGVELLGADLPGGAAISPGEPLTLTLYFHTQVPISADDTLFLHLAGAGDQLVAQFDGVPVQGRHPIRQWRPGEFFADSYVLYPKQPFSPTLGTLSLGFYPYNDPATRVPVFDGAGAPLGDRLVLASVRLQETPPPIAPLPTQPVARWQQGIQLDAGTVKFDQAGAPAAVHLTWHAGAPVHRDFTIFLQVLDAGGQVMAQVDQRPQAGAAPTSTWRGGEVVTDTLVLADVPAAWSQVIAGLYDSAGVRLPLEGAAGDYVVLAAHDETVRAAQP